MSDITELKGQTLYIDINELDIQVTDFQNDMGYISWATLELVIEHARQNDQAVSLRKDIEVKGVMEIEVREIPEEEIEGKFLQLGENAIIYKGELLENKIHNVTLPHILDYRDTDDEGFFVKLDID